MRKSRFWIYAFFFARKKHIDVAVKGTTYAYDKVSGIRIREFDVGNYGLRDGSL